MDREEKKRLRGILFRHLDGIAVGPTISALHEAGISEYILQNPHFSFQQLSGEFETNGGYLNVALRLLASQGWLQREILKDGEQIDYKLTHKGKKILSLAHHYDAFLNYIQVLINIDNYLFDSNVKTKEKDLAKLIKILTNLQSEHKDISTPKWEIFNSDNGLSGSSLPIGRISVPSIPLILSPNFCLAS